MNSKVDVFQFCGLTCCGRGQGEKASEWVQATACQALSGCCGPGWGAVEFSGPAEQLAKPMLWSYWIDQEYGQGVFLGKPLIPGLWYDCLGDTVPGCRGAVVGGCHRGLVPGSLLLWCCCCSYTPLDRHVNKTGGRGGHTPVPLWRQRGLYQIDFVFYIDWRWEISQYLRVLSKQ